MRTDRCAPLLLLVTLLAGCPEPESPPPVGDDDDSAPLQGDDDDSSEEPTPKPQDPVLLINEILAAAAPTDSPASDWIELWNPGLEPVSLERFAVRDDPEDEPIPLDPTLQVPAGGYVVLLADGEPELGPDHLPLALNVDGETLELLLDGEVVDVLDYGELLAGWSLARNGDGSHDWEVRTEPTPGTANPVGLAPNPLAEDPARCGLRDVAVEEDVLEGTPVVVNVSCAEGSLGDFDVLALTDSTTSTWDPAGTWTLETGLADARTHEVLFVAKPAGFGGVPETERSRVHVVDDWSHPNNVLVDPATYTREWGLPVLHLDPDGALSQSYIDTDAWFDGVPYSATMKIRGAASVGYPKNHFTVEFEPTQLDLRDEGLGRKDHLVLVSNFDDNAYVRQKLAFDVWAEMATWRTVPRMLPRSAWLVLYLDGVYFGLYMALDHIDDEFVREMDFEDVGTNLYKSVNHDANYYLTMNNGSTKTNLSAGWEKKEGDTADWSDLEGLTQWAGSATNEQFFAEYEDWIEIQDFVDWLLFVHWNAAADSAGKNAYIWNDPAATRFRFVPWDFNHSYGQNWRTLRVAPDWHNEFGARNAIFNHILSHPTLAAELWAHDALLREPGGPLSAERHLELIAGYYADIDTSAQRDWDKWGAAYTSYGGWVGLRSDDWQDYVGERAYVEQWLLDRADAMEVLHPLPAGP